MLIQYAVEFPVTNQANAASTVPVSARSTEESAGERVSPLPTQRKRVDAEGSSIAVSKQEQSAGRVSRKLPSARAPFTPTVVNLQQQTPVSLELLAKPVWAAIPPPPQLTVNPPGSFKELSRADLMAPQNQQQNMIQFLLQQHQPLLSAVEFFNSCSLPVVPKYISDTGQSSSLNAFAPPSVTMPPPNSVQTNRQTSESGTSTEKAEPPLVESFPANSVTNSQHSAAGENCVSSMGSNSKSKSTEETPTSTEQTQSKNTNTS